MIERILAEGDKLSPPERAQALRFAGSLYLTYQPEPQTAKAYDAYLKLLDIEPNDWGSLNNMAYLVAEQMNPPRPAEALKYSRRAYDVMTSAGGRNPLILDTHGWVLTLNNQPQEGIDLLRRAISIQSFPEAHYHLGEAYLKTGAAVDAQKQLEVAVELIRQAEEKKEPVDFALRARVEGALAKAKEAAGTKSAAAGS
jgi:tetratricopeptide (TPR) repeat protein